MYRDSNLVYQNSVVSKSHYHLSNKMLIKRQLRVTAYRAYLTLGKNSVCHKAGEKTSWNCTSVFTLLKTMSRRKMVRLGILGLTQTGAYVVYLSLSYCLMLVFMTMNIWFCLALLLGAGTGYLLFFFHPVANRLLNSLRRHQDKYEDMKSEVTTIYGSNEKQADNIALGNVGSCH